MFGDLHVSDVLVILISLLEAVERGTFGGVPNAHQVFGEIVQLVGLGLLLPLVHAGNPLVLQQLLHTLDGVGFVCQSVDLQL